MSVDSVSRVPSAQASAVVESLDTATIPGRLNRARGAALHKSPWEQPLAREPRSPGDARVEHGGAELSRAAKKRQAAADAAGRPEIQKVAGDFSSLLVQQLVREMFESVKEGEGPFGDGPGSDIERGIAETAFSQSLADSGMSSLKDAIARAISEHAPPADALPVAGEAPPEKTRATKEISR